MPGRQTPIRIPKATKAADAANARAAPNKGAGAKAPSTRPKFESARWFNSLGPCITCGKPANGKLISNRNDSIGSFCTKCGEAHAKHALAYHAYKGGK